MMGWYDHGWDSWMLATMLLWPLVIAVAAWALVVLTRGDRDNDDETPRRILDRRLATGEIDAVQYERLRGLLDNDAMTGSTKSSAG